MSKIFEFEVSSNPDNLLKQARLIAEGSGASFEIKNNYAKFNWKGIKGSLRIRDGILSITILDKPFLVSWNVVEKTLNQFFAQGHKQRH